MKLAVTTTSSPREVAIVANTGDAIYEEVARVKLGDDLTPGLAREVIESLRVAFDAHNHQLDSAD